MGYVFIVLAGILMWTMILHPKWRAKNAMPSIIQVFRDHSAIGKDNAKTIDELGFVFNIPKSTIARMFRPPNHRLMALVSLIKANVVQRTEDGKFYIPEETPAETKETEDTEREGSRSGAGAGQVMRKKFRTRKQSGTETERPDNNCRANRQAI